MFFLRSLLYLAPALVYAIYNDHPEGRFRRDEPQKISSGISAASHNLENVARDSHRNSRSITTIAGHEYTSNAVNLTNLKASLATRLRVPSRASGISSATKWPAASSLPPTASSWNYSLTFQGRAMEVAATSHLAYKTTSSVKIVKHPLSMDHPSRDPEALGLPRVPGVVFSNCHLQLVLLFPFRRHAWNTSQALKSFSTLLSRSSLFSPLAALSTAAAPSALNTSATLSPNLASGVTSQASFSTHTTAWLSTTSTGASASDIYSMPITTTITSPPSAYFTSTASNSDWTTDTTTLIEGTIRPVLVGCKVCGGLHHGIVIAVLGGAQADPRRTGCGSGSIFGSVFGCGSEFDFAPLPPFIIGLDGIPTEESADGEGGDSKVCEDDNICSLPTSEEKKSQEPTTLTIMPTSISSLGSSTISDTTPSTSGGSSREYMIFPTAGITSSELTALTEYFTDELGAGNVLPISLNDAGDQVMYVAYSSEIFASDLQTLNPKVESVVADVAQTIWDDPPAGTLLSSLHRRARNRDQGIFEHDLAKREDVDGKQESAPPELRFVSQPKGVGLDLRGDEDDLGGNVVPYYAYSSAAGEGVTVYVIDSGANPSNPEYIGMLGTKRWLEIDLIMERGTKVSTILSEQLDNCENDWRQAPTTYKRNVSRKTTLSKASPTYAAGPRNLQSLGSRTAPEYRATLFQQPPEDHFATEE
ncbi:hypothetical protein HO173_002849 [Letharia columbiana]|uniref:Uncharacterized protein n=1 Tax=Letharia columbiana TaxID=112416 RepID=A0A8H6G1V8_9LECA|nr:uncharacterized protein HO173_002849 [Letharia columbiana]KAF6238977.1 hypothetical protein HO173_002849 [Letharia columbiana]